MLSLSDTAEKTAKYIAYVWTVAQARRDAETTNATNSRLAVQGPVHARQNTCTLGSGSDPDPEIAEHVRSTYTKRFVVFLSNTNSKHCTKNSNRYLY